MLSICTIILRRKKSTQEKCLFMFSIFPIAFIKVIIYSSVLLSRVVTDKFIGGNILFLKNSPRYTAPKAVDSNYFCYRLDIDWNIMVYNIN